MKGFIEIGLLAFYLAVVFLGSAVVQQQASKTADAGQAAIVAEAK